MNTKRIFTLLSVIALFTIGIVAVSAQDTTPTPNGRRFQFNAELVQEYTGLTQDEIKEAIQSGSTLAQLLEANGQTVESFITATQAELDEYLAEAVSSGTLTQEQADRIAENSLSNFEARLNGTFEGRGNGGGRGNLGQGNLIGEERNELLQEYTGLTQEEIKAALEGGSTLAELLEANGQTVESFNTAVQAQLETTLAEAVASGNLTQEQADQLSERAFSNLEARLNGTFEGRAFGGGQGFGGRSGRGGNNAAPTEEATPNA